MKLFTKVLIAAMVLAILLPFTILKGKDGRPLMNWKDLKAPDLEMPKVPDGLKLPDTANPGKRQDVIYKWHDAKGELHFTSSPPPQGIEYEAKGYDPNANLIQSIQIKHEESAAPVAEKPQQKESQGISNPYSPEKIDKLFKDAENVQKLLDDRMKQQEAIFGNKQ